MTVTAFCLRVLYIGSFFTSNSRTKPTPYVFFSGDRLKMRRVYAMPNSAEVIKIHPFWDLSYMNFVGNPVRGLHPIGIGIFKPCISSAVYASCPCPASSRWIYLDLGIKAINKCFAFVGIMSSWHIFKYSTWNQVQRQSGGGF